MCHQKIFLEWLRRHPVQRRRNSRLVSRQSLKCDARGFSNGPYVRACACRLRGKFASVRELSSEEGVQGTQFYRVGHHLADLILSTHLWKVAPSYREGRQAWRVPSCCRGALPILPDLQQPKQNCAHSGSSRIKFNHI